MKYLLTSEMLNAGEADYIIGQITDKREKAFLRFLTGQTIYAMQMDGANHPVAPIDFLYITQIGRMMYQKRKFLDGILNGNPDDYLWGEED